MVRLFFAVVVTIVLVASSHAGQSARHTLNGVTFSCSADYRPVSIEGLGSSVALFYDAQMRALVFVAAPDERVSEAKLVADLQNAAARTIAGDGTFRWKRMFSPEAYNAFDKRRGEYWGYDGKQLVCFESHKLVFPSRTVWVGYAYFISEGQQARKDRNMGLGSLTDTVTIDASKRVARSIVRTTTGK